MAAVDEILGTAHSLARLDVACSLGLLASERVSSCRMRSLLAYRWSIFFNHLSNGYRDTASLC